jgi:hypothetical protein
MNWRKQPVRTRRRGMAEPRVPEVTMPEPSAQEKPATAAPSCGCASSGLPELQALARDPHEALAISLLRFVFAGYCSGKADAWDRGFDAAEQVLGHDGGAVLFGRLLTLGRAVKLERLGDFNFMPGRCSRISEDEIELLMAIQAARSPDPRPFEQALFVLSRQFEAERLASALRALAGLLGMIAQGQPNQRANDRPPPDRRLH